MSEIALSSFLTHKSFGAGAFDFYPRPTAIYKTAGRLRVEVGNVPLPPGVPATPNALTFLYGFRDAIEEMQRQYALADLNGMSLIKIEFTLAVGDVVTGSISEDNAAGSRFVNVRRFNDALKARVIGAMNEILRLSAPGTEVGTIDQAGSRPDLLCSVLLAMPVFSHLKAVVYSVPDGTPRGRQVATLFTTHGIDNLRFRGDLPFNLEVPLIGLAS